MRKKGEHDFADCGGSPKCVTCGCDEDDAFVGGEECSFVPDETQGKDFQQITEDLLKLIGRDDDLQQHFARGLDMELDEFQDYLDRVEFPVVGEKNKHDV